MRLLLPTKVRVEVQTFHEWFELFLWQQACSLGAEKSSWKATLPGDTHMEFFHHIILTDFLKLEIFFAKNQWISEFSKSIKTTWWYQIFFLFTPTWVNDPIWLIFFKRVETTNQKSNYKTGYWYYHLFSHKEATFCKGSPYSCQGTAFGNMAASPRKHGKPQEMDGA